MDRLTAYILAGNRNQRINKRTTLGLDYMQTLDHILEVHPQNFDVDKLDGILQDIISGSFSEGLLPDIRLAMKLHG